MVQYRMSCFEMFVSMWYRFIFSHHNSFLFLFKVIQICKTLEKRGEKGGGGLLVLLLCERIILFIKLQDDDKKYRRGMQRRGERRKRR